MANPEFDIKRPTMIGDTADISLQKTIQILRSEGINPIVVMEFSSSNPGTLCGLNEAKTLLEKILPENGSEVWAVEEGNSIQAGEVALRVKAPYASIGLYETAITGILSSCTGWASAAKECVDEAQGTPIYSTGAKNVHPNVSATMDYASIIGGCISCSTILGARMSGVTPITIMSHSLSLIMGDTVRALQSFDKHTPQDIPRIALVDTHRDESEEAIATARVLKNRLRGIRIDTSSERGGVTVNLVKEVRARLDLAGFQHVDISISGGLTPAKIKNFIESKSPVQSFGVGSYIASANSNPFTGDIHEIDDRPIAKRGRIPGVTINNRLHRII
jgi:nicotinate phosphoribosyltransferase